MQIEQRIVLLSELGQKLKVSFFDDNADELYSAIRNNNPWFTKDNVQLTIQSIISNFLSIEKLTDFCNAYPIVLPQKPKKIGIVAAGNIPAVGFQDLLIAFLTGNDVNIKLSSTDNFLMRYIINIMYAIEPQLKNNIKEVQTITNSDAYIATGSDNSARYFDYYFAKKPSIIRKNRTSLAVLSGNENKIDLANLGNDIFQYFGLGCRNISKLLVPPNYDFTSFFEAIDYWNTIQMHHKYNNNYDYNKSVYLVNREPHFDNGFLLLKKSDALVSPLSVVFYEEYESEKQLNAMLENSAEKIQCVVGNGYKFIPFGNSQQPQLSDFADNVDTVAFLLALGKSN